MTDSLMQRLSGMDWPAPCTDRPEPQRGQLWRAAWAGSAGLVVVVGRAAGGRVPVAAATADCVGDERSVVVSTANGMRVAVWAGLSAEILATALDHRIGDLTPEGLAAVTDTADGCQIGEWAPITSILDDRVLIRLDLEAKLQGFASGNGC